MTQMFKDINNSKDMQNDFKNHLGGTNSVQGVEFTCEVLTNGTWPQMDQPKCGLPMQLKACSDRFEMFFKQKN